MKNNKMLVIILWILLMAAISVAPVLAQTVSPPGCNADNSVVNIARSTASAQPGQTVSFTISAGNPTSVDGCDIVNRYLTLTLPDGTIQTFGPFDYPNGAAVVVVYSVDYITKVADVVGGSWTGTVDWTGTQLDGYNSPSTGSKQTSITYVPVNLQVVKTATPAIQQGYTWTIDKNVIPTSWSFNYGDSGTSEYTISVVKSPSGTTYSVSGTITITNPATYESAHITSVTDVITLGINAVVDCQVSLPYDLTPGAQLVCTYSATLLDGATRTNEVTVVITGDIGGGSGTAPVDFTGVTPTVTGAEIDVDDNNPGNPGPWHFTDSGFVTYTKTFDCSGLIYDASGHASYCKSNTATIRGTALSDDAKVCVECYKPPTPILPKIPKVCVWGRDIVVDGINILDFRFGQYAFTGEQIKFNITVRDPKGAEDIGYVKLQVGEEQEVLCNPTYYYDGPCNGFGPFNNDTDRTFVCELTVEPDWYGEKELAIAVFDINDNPTLGLHKETWFFNPAISLSVETSDDQPIRFEKGGPGDIVHSLNRMIIRNLGEGGVNLWMYMAGTDFYGTGVAKCPTTNKLDIEDWMKFQAWSGTISGDWTNMSEYDENDACSLFGTCYGGVPLPGSAPFNNILTNNGILEVQFKLEYPMPCIGKFGAASIIIIGKAI